MQYGAKVYSTVSFTDVPSFQLLIHKLVVVMYQKREK